MKILILCIFSLLLYSCCNKSMEANESKLDVPLKVKLKEIAGSDTVRIGIIGKCYENITDKLKTELKDTGAGIQSVINNIFIAEATGEEISRLSNLDIVILIELSQNKEPK